MTRLRSLVVGALAAGPTCAYVAHPYPRFGRHTPLQASEVASEGLVLSPAATNIQPSKTIEVHALTQAMIARGEDVVSLCVGEPDFDPPQAILDATAQAAKDGLTRYTAVSGTVKLREAIAKHLDERKGTKYAADEILVANGAKQAVYQAVLATVRAGDEVIIPAPYWPSYPEMVKLAGGAPVIVETKREDGYLLQPDVLAAALTPRTRLLIFCNPSNPTGAVHDQQAVEALASVLANHEHGGQVWVCSDEIYERLVYDGVECPAFAAVTVPGPGGAPASMWPRTLTVNGFSKAYAMTGYRLGYLAAPRAVAKACGTLQGQITSCASSVAQAAGLAALGLTDEDLAPLIDEMRAKRDMVYARLEAIPGVKVPESPPSGAFYLLPEVDSFFGRTSGGGPVDDLKGGAALTDATALCVALLSETGVALVTGDGFGAPSAIRISYAASRGELTMALDRLEAWLARAK
mmetsp:Transcript_60411/g.136559  ORF Transcript_60411/g.136559 Transcript_60411/m.136559 type:complete len:464 (-) Transcript_60411:231-1622(-)|eukprot:CAMPEP_0172615594 /NCGR_PEP_ID=MMETSP1068-20121228/60975_1 /TAXON_ID=35684 /ORGANISM="Pseudopedinella elastica, Strain CCMP716" /LENGTH=463 /DNA_ID=CAMNT_0013420797 /DNA_START=95 /DNA_END=1486 /DNA_ORIENTATION=+